MSPSYGPTDGAHNQFRICCRPYCGASFLYGTLVSLYGTVVGLMIYFMFVGVNAVIYGLKRKKGGTGAVLTIAGVLSAIVFLHLSAGLLLYRFPGPTVA